MSGIVRRIDDLGRIVIPKEIRRSLKIKNGEALDIEVVDNKIFLKKYSNFLDIQNIIDSIVYVSGKVLEKDLLIFDRNTIVSGSFKILDSLVGQEISEDLFHFISDRKNNYVYHGVLKIVDSEVSGNFLLTSIIPNGDVIGGVMIYSKDEDFSEEDMFISCLIRDILTRYIEE